MVRPCSAPCASAATTPSTEASTSDSGSSPPTALAPIDDTPFQANKRLKKAEAAHAKAKAAVALAQQTQRRHAIFNDLIAASVDKRLLKDWKGDLAVDEHVIHRSSHNYEYFGRPGLHGGTPMSSYYPEQHRTGKGYHIGLTRILPAAEPYGHRQPDVVLAAILREASAGNVEATLMSIDAAGEARGLRPTTPRTKRPYVIADRGYTPQGTFNHDLTARGYSVLMRYQKNHKTTHDLAKAAEDHPTAPGPWLYRGAILCPAAGRLLNDRRTTPPAPGEKDANVLMAHARQEALLNALEMPINGHPQAATLRPPGRPSPRPHEPKPLPVR